MPTGTQFGDYSPIQQFSAIPTLTKGGIGVIADLGNDMDSYTLMAKAVEMSDVIFVNGDLFYETEECKLVDFYNNTFAPWTGKRIKNLSRKYQDDDVTKPIVDYLIEFETIGAEQCKFFFTAGNHDNRFRLFWMKVTNQQYWTFSVDIGNYFHVLCLNSQRYDPMIKTSQNEIESDIQNARNRGKKLIIKMHHIPSEEFIENGTGLRRPLVDRAWDDPPDHTQNDFYFIEFPSWINADGNKKTELVIFGHKHNYERFERTLPDGISKTVYIVNGCGGNSLQGNITGFETLPHVKVYDNDFEGFTHISLKQGATIPTMVVKFVDKNGNIPIMQPSNTAEVIEIPTNIP